VSHSLHSRARTSLSPSLPPLFSSHLFHPPLDPIRVSKKDLGECYLSKLQLFHHIQRGTSLSTAEFRKGLPPHIKIQFVRRQGRKVTLVTGLETFLVTPEEAASEFQKIFAASTTTLALPGKNVIAKEVLIQGDVAKRVSEVLTDKYNIPKRFMDVTAAPPGGKGKGGKK
jgi:translation initiation factor 1 (eIF-1/SUI1)